MKKGTKIGLASVSLVLANALCTNHKVQFTDRLPATEDLMSIEIQVREIELARNCAKRIQGILWSYSEDEAVRLTEIGIGLIVMGALMVGGIRKVIRKKQKEADERMVDEREELKEMKEDYVKKLKVLSDRLGKVMTPEEYWLTRKEFDALRKTIQKELMKKGPEIYKAFLLEYTDLLCENYTSRLQLLCGKPLHIAIWEEIESKPTYEKLKTEYLSKLQNLGKRLLRTQNLIECRELLREFGRVQIELDSKEPGLYVLLYEQNIDLYRRILARFSELKKHPSIEKTDDYHTRPV